MRATSWRLLAGRVLRAPCVADGTAREGPLTACSEGLLAACGQQPNSLLNRLAEALVSNSSLHATSSASGTNCGSAASPPGPLAHAAPAAAWPPHPGRGFSTSRSCCHSSSGSSSIHGSGSSNTPAGSSSGAADGPASTPGTSTSGGNGSSKSGSSGGSGGSTASRAAAGARGKAAARAKAAAASQVLLPAAHHHHHHAQAARGAKGKAGKAPGAKAAAASVAVKAGGQRPLSDEARRQLDAQLEALAAHGVVAGSRKPAVKAVGYYIGHAIRPEDVTLLLHGLEVRPPPGLVAGDTFRHTDHTVLLLRPAPHTHHTHHNHDAATQQQQQQQQQQPLEDTGAYASGQVHPQQGGGGVAGGGGGGAPHGGEPGRAAAEGSSAGAGWSEVDSVGQQQESAAPGSCQAVVLHEYGGVAFFNVPPHLMSDLLQRIVRTVIPSTALMAVRAAGSSSSGSSSSGSLSAATEPAAAASAAAAAGGQEAGRTGPGGGVYAVAGGAAAAAASPRPELLLHSEEEEFILDEAVDSAPRLQRYIRKEGDAYIISRWDSVNMESVARVLSQSAAIRHYNQICEDMLRRYMALVPADTPDLEQEQEGGGVGGVVAWRRSLLPRRLLAALGGSSRRARQLPLKQLRSMVAKSTSIHVFLESSLLGVAEPPTSTWASARHHKVWDVVHDEFELDDRQELLVGKAALIKQSCLDLINAHNDTFAKRSEITIIALIATEIVISLCGLHDLLPLRALLLGGGAGAGAGGGGAGH